MRGNERQQNLEYDVNAQRLTDFLSEKVALYNRVTQETVGLSESRRNGPSLVVFSHCDVTIRRMNLSLLSIRN
jgi:hypothetical protein